MDDPEGNPAGFVVLELGRPIVISRGDSTEHYAYDEAAIE